MIAKNLLKTINASINDIIFIGDTNMDVKVALNNQCKVIALTYGHHSYNRFPLNKNILLVNSVSELKSCLLSLLLDSP